MVHPRVPREGRLGVWGYPGSLTCAAERSERNVQRVERFDEHELHTERATIYRFR